MSRPITIMIHLVFAQALGPSVDTASLAANAQRYFKATLKSLPAPESASETTRLELEGPHGVSGTFAIVQRPRTPADLARARIAEERGRAAGMAGLAERCPFVWQVEPEAGVDLTATLMLCAIIASAALGPVLPPDDSTLFGVRGAMERVERLLDAVPSA
jgi:hypothetical protein